VRAKPSDFQFWKWLMRVKISLVLILLKIEMGVDVFFERRIAKRSTFGHLISLVNIVHEKKKISCGCCSSCSSKYRIWRTL
jgi:hypothetical protein